MKKEKYVRICPCCGSIDIHVETRARGGYAEGGGGTFCRKCNYYLVNDRSQVSKK